MAAILVKVGSLALKTLAKPLSNYFTAYVMGHPEARQYAITAAQAMHKLEVLITRSADGKTGRAFVGSMTEEKSIEMASKLASEGFVFTVGIAIVAFEYERQRVKEIDKKRQEADEKMQIMERARLERERLAKESEDQNKLIKHLMERVDTLETSLQMQIEAAVRSSRSEQEEAKRRQGMFGGFFGVRGNNNRDASTAAQGSN
ncbi:hypothetical protein CEUSTIGMA_g10387.t1 [Chlamydomonas eustigma]|uniref:OPA3-like protein n=1 Tax=Chlamydomonas eustigma TaxID=1157962 RepID=A0A250XJI1_9CHLO|nr:hypothetical protein CEUSTIGMA_g10387.t1 [Chlamydomonas eustigma]|eukprot:GAX82960.1 hypothetical protein CEUSTIGMA_g10387.t1 [Chlamydomonas eustigma]